MPTDVEKIQKNAEAVLSKGLLNAPSWINYGRVFLDVVMTILLIFVVSTDVGRNDLPAGSPLHVHQVPVYLKEDIGFPAMWSDSLGDASLLNDQAKVSAFMAKAQTKCATIITHPMCVCIAANTQKSVIVAKNCLLSNPTPSVISDWNVGAVSSAMILWFLASLATSVGTLPIINSYMSVVSVEQQNVKGIVITWNKYIIASYALITLSAIIVPLIVTATQFPGSAKHMESVLGMLMWSACAIVVLGSFNHQTIFRYLGYAMIPPSNERLEPENDAALLHLSLNNWILYVHLLVSAPAIAMVLHLTQQWTEFHTIVNTTLILSTIFAVDAFSVEMANFWAHRSTKHSLKSDTVRNVEQEEKDMQELHTRLGLIRLFSWVVNAVMLVLLFTLAYPIEIEHQQTNGAVFVIIVIAFAAVFLAPDLVREFTDRVSFNSIQFRLYGDFGVRALVLFFVWRASVVERI
jgi:hypothetical protein